MKRRAIGDHWFWLDPLVRRAIAEGRVRFRPVRVPIDARHRYGYEAQLNGWSARCLCPGGRAHPTPEDALVCMNTALVRA